MSFLYLSTGWVRLALTLERTGSSLSLLCSCSFPACRVLTTATHTPTGGQLSPGRKQNKGRTSKKHDWRFHSRLSTTWAPCWIITQCLIAYSGTNTLKDGWKMAIGVPYLVRVGWQRVALSLPSGQEVFLGSCIPSKRQKRGWISLNPCQVVRRWALGLLKLSEWVCFWLWGSQDSEPALFF